MRIIRRHTAEMPCPYDGVELVKCQPPSPDHSNQPRPFQEQNFEFEAPAHWSDAARDLLATCAARIPVAGALTRIPEDDVPDWLWRHETKEAADEAFEENAFQVIDRVAAGLCYRGWKAGYFDSETDARNWFDELRWLMIHQRWALDINELKYTGLFWAYGIDAADPSSCLYDWQTGSIRAAKGDDLPPCGMVINGLNSDAPGARDLRGLMNLDLTAAEGGMASASNPSLNAAPPDALSVYCENQPDIRRSITIDADHPSVCRILGEQRTRDIRFESLSLGTIILRRHLQAIIDAWPQSATDDPAETPALITAIRVARQLPVPPHLLNQLLDALQTGNNPDLDTLLGPEPAVPPPDRRLFGVRFKDEPLAEDHPAVVALIRTIQENNPARALFASNLDHSSLCPDAGRCNATSPDGGLVFADNIQIAGSALNIASFVAADGTIEIDSLRHAVKIAVIAQDIIFDMTATHTAVIANRRWEYRPILLSFAGLGSAFQKIVRSALNSDPEQTLVALCALASGGAYRASAEIADERGSFPAFARNRTDIICVLNDAKQRVIETIAALEDSDTLPAMRRALSNEWDAVTASAPSALRHAHLTAISAPMAPATLLDCDQNGLFDAFSSEKADATRLSSTELASMIASLGYNDGKTQSIVEHLCGRRSLANSPGINHANLRRCGFTEASLRQIDDWLNEATDLSQCFTADRLGREFCRQNLNFDDTDLNCEEFDMLAALGFSDAGIEAAQNWCFGTGDLTTAPILSIIQKRALGSSARGDAGNIDDALLLAAAIQKIVSGGIGETLVLPESFDASDILATLVFARSLGLKTITLRQHSPGQRKDCLGVGPSTPHTIIADKTAAQQNGAQSSLQEINRTPFAKVRSENAGGEHSSREAPGPAPARSAATVPSSADAASEQRQH